MWAMKDWNDLCYSVCGLTKRPGLILRPSVLIRASGELT